MRELPRYAGKGLSVPGTADEPSSVRFFDELPLPRQRERAGVSASASTSSSFDPREPHAQKHVAYKFIPLRACGGGGRVREAGGGSSSELPLPRERERAGVRASASTSSS